MVNRQMDAFASVLTSWMGEGGRGQRERGGGGAGGRKGGVMLFFCLSAVCDVDFIVSCLLFGKKWLPVQLSWPRLSPIFKDFYDKACTTKLFTVIKEKNQLQTER
jgi:hypothetical protein